MQSRVLRIQSQQRPPPCIWMNDVGGDCLKVLASECPTVGENKPRRTLGCVSIAASIQLSAIREAMPGPAPCSAESPTRDNGG